MALQIRPDYVNPLTMMADKTATSKLEPAVVKQDGQTDQVTKLQNEQQQLQNQMLLLKATGTDSAGAAAETQKAVEAELEKVTAELRTAVRRSQDLYEPEKAGAASPGIYQLEKDAEQGYQISFLPYAES